MYEFLDPQNLQTVLLSSKENIQVKVYEIT